ncbi:MAG: hypothetical protein ACI4SO_00750 [Muribaculaceae bacterium]
MNTENETMFDREQTEFGESSSEKTKVAEKQPKSAVWKKVAIGGVACIALGIGTALVVNAQPKEGATDEGSEDNGGENAGGESGSVQAVVPETIEMASGVSEEMSFSEAFEAARTELGPGGVFVWHGGVYGTYSTEEWNSLSEEEQAHFTNEVPQEAIDALKEPESQVEDNIEVDPVEVMSEEIPETATEVEVETTSEEAAEEVSYAIEEQVEDYHYEDDDLIGEVEIEGVDENGVSGAAMDTDEEDVVATVCDEQPVEEIPAGVYHNAELGINVAVVEAEGQEVYVVDSNDDMIADVMAVDLNNDMRIDSNEIQDISEAHISMTDIAGTAEEFSGEIEGTDMAY